MALRTRDRSGRPVGPLVVTADAELLDHVLAAAAAAGVEATVMDDVASVRSAWITAPMVVIGADRAHRLADLVLPHRAEVVLVGRQEDVALERWSGPLGAAVAMLPEAVGWLTAALADVTGRDQRSGQIVGVIGGVGGAGASTVAAGLAVSTVASGAAALVTDLDPSGGGIDLLMGVEGESGWRWPRLASAQGHVGDIADHLPHAGGVGVLATGRGPAAFDPVGVQAVKAVLTAAARHHAVVVVDLPRDPTPAAREALRLSDAVLVCTTADVRGVAGARQILQRLGELEGPRPRVIVRRPRAGGIDPSLVAQSLDVALLVAFRDDPTVVRSAESGEPPGRARRSVLGRAMTALASQLGVSDRAAA